MTREPTEAERQRVEFYCRRIGKVLQGAEYYLALSALRVLVSFVIEKALVEHRPQILDDFCTELRREIRKGMQ